MDLSKWTPKDSKATALARMGADLKLLRQRHKRALGELERERASGRHLLAIQENLMALLGNEQAARAEAEARVRELEIELAGATPGPEDNGQATDFGPVS